MHLPQPLTRDHEGDHGDVENVARSDVVSERIILISLCFYLLKQLAGHLGGGVDVLDGDLACRLGPAMSNPVRSPAG